MLKKATFFLIFVILIVNQSYAQRHFYFEGEIKTILKPIKYKKPYLIYVLVEYPKKRFVISEDDAKKLKLIDNSKPLIKKGQRVMFECDLRPVKTLYIVNVHKFKEIK